MFSFLFYYFSFFPICFSVVFGLFSNKALNEALLRKQPCYFELFYLFRIMIEYVVIESFTFDGSKASSINMSIIDPLTQ